VVDSVGAWGGEWAAKPRWKSEWATVLIVSGVSLSVDSTNLIETFFLKNHTCADLSSFP
jgi:hypothetical protein